MNQPASGGGRAPGGSPSGGRIASYTSREASKSNGSGALAERPKCDGSGIASITPVTVVSTALPIDDRLAERVVRAEESRGGLAREHGAARGRQCRARVARHERQSKDVEELRIDRDAESRTAFAPFATIVLRSMTTARATFAIPGKSLFKASAATSGVAVAFRRAPGPLPSRVLTLTVTT